MLWTDLAAAELLTTHNCCHSFTLSSFLSFPFLRLILSPLNHSNFLSFSSCHCVSRHHICLFISLFLPIVPSSSLSLCNYLVLSSQPLYFYELRDSVLLISIFLWCKTESVTGVTASRSAARTTRAHTGKKAHISITLSHEISSPLTKALSHTDICQLGFPLPRGIMVIFGRWSLRCCWTVLHFSERCFSLFHWYKQDGKK